MAKICVYGAGAVGCYIGGRLLASGSDVSFVGRGRVPGDVRKHGLMLSDHRNRWWHIPSFAAHFSTDITRVAAADLVLLAVRSMDMPAAATELAGLLKPGATVITFQSGMRCAELLRNGLPQHAVLESQVLFEVVTLGYGIFHQVSAGGLEIRAGQGLLPFLPEFSQAGIPLRMHTDMLPVQWGALLLAINQSINALANRPLREQFIERAYRHCLALAQEEALELLAETGIKPLRLGRFAPAWMPRLLRLPCVVFSVLGASLLDIDPLARSAMSDDLADCRDTEVDWINGDVVRLARRLGRRAPVNARLCQLVHEAERSPIRPAWRGDHLLAELQAARSGKRGKIKQPHRDALRDVRLT